MRRQIGQLQPGIDSHSSPEADGNIPENSDNTVSDLHDSSYCKIRPLPTTSSVLPPRTSRGKPPTRLNL